MFVPWLKSFIVGTNMYNLEENLYNVQPLNIGGKLSNVRISSHKKQIV